MSDRETPFRDLKVDDIKKLVDEGGREIVDVREDWEWNKGHLPGARHVVLSYDIAIKPERVDVKMTLTALGCPMAADVMADVRDHLLTLPGITDAGVDIVYEPVWTPERMSEEARWELGMV